MFAPLTDAAADPAIRGFLHEPSKPNGSALVLTHGAGANCQSKLLIAMSNAFEAAGFAVLRFDLPFRTERLHGPPRPGSAAKDRDGLRRVVQLMKERKYQRILMGGHSYGGRQATMLASEEPDLVAGLLLLSYPLHPPKKPEQLRTSHLPKLKTPAFFVHGTRDPFGTLTEMASALKLIPARHELLKVEGAGHDLAVKKAEDDLPARVANAFLNFIRES